MRTRTLTTLGFVAAFALIATVAVASRGGLDGPVHGNDLPDPELAHDGTRFVLLSTNIGEMGVTINVPALTTTDFATWDYHGDALPDLGVWADAGFTWSPSLLEVPRPGAEPSTWVLFYTANVKNTPTQCIGVATSASPTGPFVDRRTIPLVCQGDLGGSIDPSAFVDGDGKAYLLWKSDENAIGNRPRLWSAPLAATGTSLAGSARVLLSQDRRWEDGNADTAAFEPWKRVIEQPELVAVDGGYTLFYAGNWWQSDRYGIGWATCKSPLGPCTKRTTSGPWISTADGVTGPGGISVIDGVGIDPGVRSRLGLVDGLGVAAFHGWRGPPSYARGSARVVHVEAIDLRGPRPVLRTDQPRLGGSAGPAVNGEGVSGERQVTAGDFDGDGHGDVFFSRPGAAGEAMLWGAGGGAFGVGAAPSVGGTYEPLAGDYDGDGATEVLWYTANGADYLWDWNGRSHTSRRVSVGGDYDPVVGDFDGDGADDILWYAPGRAADYHWWGRLLLGGFDSTRTAITGTYDPIAGDFDGDGATDVFWYRPGPPDEPVWWSVPLRRGVRVDARVSVRGTYEPVAVDLDGTGRDQLVFYGPGRTRHPVWPFAPDRTHGDERLDLARGLGLRALDLDDDVAGADLYGHRAASARDVVVVGRPPGVAPDVQFVRLVGI